MLALGITRHAFMRNGKRNAAAAHDLGLAAGSLVLEAGARGLYVHQMIGVLPDRARELYAIPDHSQALTGLAIGYLGEPEALPESLQERDRAPRTRKPLAEFVFGEQYGETSAIAKG